MMTTRDNAIYHAKAAHRLLMTRGHVPDRVDYAIITFENANSGDMVAHHLYTFANDHGDMWRVELRDNGALVMAGPV